MDDDGIMALSTDDEMGPPPVVISPGRTTGFDEQHAQRLFAKLDAMYSSLRRARRRREGIVDIDADAEVDAKLRQCRRSSACWVEKPVRMLVRWTCHECMSAIGSNKMCRACGHRRCNQCGRTPTRDSRRVAELATRPGVDRHRLADELPARQVVDRPALEVKTSPTTALDPVSRIPETRIILPAIDTTCSAETKALLHHLKFSPLEADDTVNEWEKADDKHHEQSGHNIAADAEPVVHNEPNEAPAAPHPDSAPSALDAPTQIVLPTGHRRVSPFPVGESRTSNGRTTASETPAMLLPPTMPRARVYHKVRQRKRMFCCTCHSGNDLDSHRCVACDHQWCTSCVRVPRKRPALPSSGSTGGGSIEQSLLQ